MKNLRKSKPRKIGLSNGRTEPAKSSGLARDRERILASIRNATEPVDYFHCMWEGGAAAFKRVDEWSDIDLQVAVDDGKVDQAVDVIEKTLGEVGPIERRFVLPKPTSHGHWQGFYKLAGMSPFLLLDLVVMKRSASNRFAEPEIHGEARVHYDKIGFLKSTPIDREELAKKLEARKQVLRDSFELFQPFVEKELKRGNYAEAIGYYNAVTLRPLVELLRTKHAPTRHDFYTRYIYYDLPLPIAKKLEPFFYVRDPGELKRKHRLAVKWVRALLG